MKSDIIYLSHKLNHKDSIAEYDRYSCEICGSICIIYGKTKYHVYDIFLSKIDKLTCNEVLIKNIIE